MSTPPLKTEGVDISPVAVDNAAAYLEETGYPQSAAMLRKLSEQLTLGQAWIGGYARMEAERDAARAALTASEKQREEAVRLLWAVGAGGIFTLMAESSDDADVWYDQRDAILKGQF